MPISRLAPTGAGSSSGTLTVNGVAIALNSAIETIDFALDSLSNIRIRVGAIQNRLTSTISSLQVASENPSAARSLIRDADVAVETAELSRNQIGRGLA